MMGGLQDFYFIALIGIGIRRFRESSIAVSLVIFNYSTKTINCYSRRQPYTEGGQVEWGISVP